MIEKLIRSTSAEIGDNVDLNRELKKGVAFEINKNEHYDFLKKSSFYKIISIKKKKICFTCDELIELNEEIF